MPKHHLSTVENSDRTRCGREYPIAENGFRWNESDEVVWVYHDPYQFSLIPAENRCDVCLASVADEL